MNTKFKMNFTHQEKVFKEENTDFNLFDLEKS
jgi:hypothetical protein